MAIDLKTIQAQVNSFLETKLVPLGNKPKIAILAVSIVVPLVAFYFLVVSPKQQEIQALEGKRASLAKELVSIKAVAQQLDKHKAELAQTEAQFQEASLLLPQKQEIPSLLTNISGLGTKSGLEFLSFQPRAEVPQEFYAEIPVDIEVRGPYHNVGTFLYEISKLARIVSVTNIIMDKPTPTDEGEMLLSSRFTLVTYRFIEKSSEEKKEPPKKSKKS